MPFSSRFPRTDRFGEGGGKNGINCLSRFFQRFYQFRYPADGNLKFNECGEYPLPQYLRIQISISIVCEERSDWIFFLELDVKAGEGSGDRLDIFETCTDSGTPEFHRDVDETSPQPSRYVVGFHFFGSAAKNPG